MATDMSLLHHPAGVLASAPELWGKRPDKIETREGLEVGGNDKSVAMSASHVSVLSSGRVLVSSVPPAHQQMGRTTRKFSSSVPPLMKRLRVVFITLRLPSR